MKKIHLAAASLILLNWTQAWAQSPSAPAAPLEVTAKEPVVIYKSQEAHPDNQLLTLQPGQSGFLSLQKTPGWRKILVVEGRAKQIGWVPVSDLKGKVKLTQHSSSRDIEEKLPPLRPAQSFQKAPSKSQVYAKNTGIGLQYQASHLRWGKRTFTLSDETNWTVSDSTSTTFWPTVFLDLSFPSSKAMVRVFAGQRTAEFSGTSTTDFIGTKDTSFELEFLTFGAFYKRYRGAQFWWGVGADWNQGQDLKIIYDRDTIETSEEDYPIFMNGLIGTGYDWPITKKVYLLPEAKAGLIFNQNPRIWNFEIGVGLAFSL